MNNKELNGIKMYFNLWQSEKEFDNKVKRGVIGCIIGILIFLIPVCLSRYFIIDKHYIFFCLYVAVLLLLLSINIVIYGFIKSNKLKINNHLINNLVKYTIMFIEIFIFVITVIASVPVILTLKFLEYLSSLNAKSIDRFLKGVFYLWILISIYYSTGLIILKICKLLFNNKYVIKYLNYIDIRNIDIFFIEIVVSFNIIIFISDFIYKTFVSFVEVKMNYKKYTEYDKIYLIDNILGKTKFIVLTSLFFITASGIHFRQYKESIVNAITFATLVVLIKDKSREYKNKLENNMI